MPRSSLGSQGGVRGEAFHVQFVDDGLAPGHVRMGRFSRMFVGRAIVDGHGDGHVAKGIHGAHWTERRSRHLAVFDLALVGERARIELHLAFDAFGIGVEQQFVGIEAYAVVRVPWAVDAVSVLHAVPGFGHVHIPQTVVRPVHAEQRLPKVERRYPSRADVEFLRLIDEGDIRLVEQAGGVGVEEAWLVKRLEHAEPCLCGAFGTDDGVRSAIVGEIQSGTCGVAM